VEGSKASQEAAEIAHNPVVLFACSCPFRCVHTGALRAAGHLPLLGVCWYWWSLL